jgi:tetratricopeptide (TPR) repeat protein
MWVFGLSVFIVAILFGCAGQSSSISTDNSRSEESTKPGYMYYPKLPSGIETLDAAKKDLADLLQTDIKRYDDNPGIRYYGQLDFNKPANQNNLAEYLTRVLAYMIIRDTKGEFIYMIPRCRITVLDDRLNVGTVFAFFYTDVLDSHITVERSRDEEIRTSWLGSDGRIYDDTIGGESIAKQYRPLYQRPYMIHCSGLISFFFKKQTDAQRFADDLFFIQQTLQKTYDERRASFESLATQYRGLAIKPPVSEEQRKYIVQANVLNQQKDYAGAIDLYLKAIDLDPVAYPGAYFNLALLSAQLHRFKLAISYMKQYLLLVPDAKDARSAQDKIYEWEIMMGK